MVPVKKNMRWLRRAVCLALTLALVVPLMGPATVVPASAVTQQEINALKEEAEDLDARQEELQEQLEAVQSDKEDALSQKQLLEQQIGVIQREIDNIDEQIAMYDQLIAALPQSVPVLTTGTLFSFGGAGALLAVVLFFAFTRGRRAALGLAAPRPFRLWNIPRAYTPGLIGLYVLALVLRLFEFANADAVYYAVSALLGVPLVTQGLAMIAFLLSRRRYPSRSLNAVVFAALALLLPMTGSMLSTLGLLEQLVRLRERELPPVSPPYRGA